MGKIDHEYTSCPVCPNCGEKYSLTEEWQTEGEEYTCSCGKTFVVSLIHYKVTYCTELKRRR